MKQPLYIFDIDGTLALMNGRSPYDWSRAGEDLPNVPVIAVLRALLQQGHKAGFASGRKERARYPTELWLLANIVVLPHIEYLWMRADDDDRPDEVVKREIYVNHIEPFFEIPGVFDDRNKIVAMWRSLGLTCFQVNDGPKEDHDRPDGHGNRDPDQRGYPPG